MRSPPSACTPGATTDVTCGNAACAIWRTVVRVADIAAITGIDDIRVAAGDSVLAQGEAGVASALAAPGPVDGRSVLLVKEGTSHAHATYECLDKQLVKAFRP